MDLYRFHIPDLRQQVAQSDSTVHLPPDEAHHARSVLRLESGQTILLFDGLGAWTPATLEKVTKSVALARPLEPLHLDPPPPMHLTLATAVPKGDRAEWLIEQASQLNASAVQWLACDRSVVKPREGGGKMDKFRRLAVESAKQCARTHLLLVEEPVPLETVLQRAPAAALILWLDPRPGGQPLRQALPPAATAIIALIGPEGGWSPREWSLLEAAERSSCVQRIHLTPTILRIETACAAAAAIIMSA